MVLHSDGSHLVEVKLCQLSLYRHDKSNVFLRTRNKAVMGDHPDSNKLPLVEPHPFTKKCWRREKSLPVFYDKPEPVPQQPELIAKTSNLMKELETDRSCVGSAVESVTLKKTSAHPKAEFPSGWVQPWRTHDFIPSFISRLERTKTSLLKAPTLEQGKELVSSIESPTAQQRYNKMRVMGGRLHHRMPKRQLVYLNPMDEYGYDIRPPVSSHSEPGASRFNYEDSRSHDSQHMFHRKLGAAKNALDIMTSCGPPTGLEINLRNELTLNLERYRRDHTLLHSYMLSPAQQFALNDKNCTPGERLLQLGRKANTSRKLKHQSEVLSYSSPAMRTSTDLSCSLDGTLVTIIKCPTERGQDVESKVTNLSSPARKDPSKHLGNDLRMKPQLNKHCLNVSAHENINESKQYKKKSFEVDVKERSGSGSEASYKYSLTKSDEAEFITNNDENEQVQPTNKKDNMYQAEINNKKINVLNQGSEQNQSIHLLKGRSHSANAIGRIVNEKKQNESPEVTSEVKTQTSKTTAEYLHTIMAQVDLSGHRDNASDAEHGSGLLHSDVIAVNAGTNNINIAIIC